MLASPRKYVAHMIHGSTDTAFLDVAFFHREQPVHLLFEPFGRLALLRKGIMIF
jgi:hypothetical protein